MTALGFVPFHHITAFTDAPLSILMPEEVPRAFASLLVNRLDEQGRVVGLRAELVDAHVVLLVASVPSDSDLRWRVELVERGSLDL